LLCSAEFIIILTSRLIEQRLQSLGGTDAIELSGGNIENERFPVGDVQLFSCKEIIRFKKDEAGRKRSAFVAIDEWMILAKIKKIRRCHFNGITDERLPHHRGLWRGHCGLEQRLITDASGTAVRPEHLFVNRFDGRYRKMSDVATHARRLKSLEFLLMMRLAVTAAFFASMRGRTGVSVIVPPS
jgi:hypothetical protein